MSWTKVDGDAQCEMAHFLFPSAKSVRENFATVVRMEDITNWRDTVFEIVACACGAIFVGRSTM